jgi:predicted nucleic acid-binding protein
VSPDRLDEVIRAEATLLVDTSATLAYLAGSEPASPAAEQVFDGFIGSGRNAGLLSTVTVAEILVRPFRAGPGAVARTEAFLRHFGEIRLVGVDYEVAREAARIRARTNLRMPDALIVASAVVGGADVVVTNDEAWTAAVAAVAPTLVVCVLGSPRARSATGRRARRPS